MTGLSLKHSSDCSAWTSPTKNDYLERALLLRLGSATSFAVAACKFLGITVRMGLPAGNFVLYELSAQATRALRLWAGRTTWRLRRTPEGLRLCRKIVELVTASEPQPTLAFIL